MSVATVVYQVKKFNQQSKAPIKAKFLKEKKGRQTSILSYTPRFQVELSVEASLILSLEELAMHYCYNMVWPGLAGLRGVSRIGRIFERFACCRSIALASCVAQGCGWHWQIGDQ